MRRERLIPCLPARRRRFTKSAPALFALLLLPVLLASSTQAQQNQYEPPPLPVDPTPLIQLITAKERALLEREKSNPKELVKTYLDIADVHLDAALSAIKDDDYKTSERELDIYNKAIREATKTAFAQADIRRKLAKKIEQEIYKHLKLLEAIERYFPPERTPFIEFALQHARQARSQALNIAFDSGEILKDPNKGNSKNERDQEELFFFTWAPARQERPRTLSGHQVADLQARLRPVALRLIAIESRTQEVDYLTEEEDDLVRQAQEPDLRARVFMKIADRRLEAITGKTVDPNDKKAQKKAEEELRNWGVLPKLDRAGYLRHYARALDEVMIKLEDAFERNPKAKAFEKALTILRDSTDKQIGILKSFESQMSSEAEKVALRHAIDKAEVANQGAKAGPKVK